MNTMDLARQLYGPTIGTLLSNMDDLGESLHTAATDLSRDCDLAAVDSFLDRLQAAINVTVHIRKALAAEETTAHGTG